MLMHISVQRICQGASGAVAKDENGDFIVAPSWFIPHVGSVGSAEILVVRNGINQQYTHALLSFTQ